MNTYTYWKEFEILTEELKKEKLKQIKMAKT